MKISNSTREWRRFCLVRKLAIAVMLLAQVGETIFGEPFVPANGSMILSPSRHRGGVGSPSATDAWRQAWQEWRQSPSNRVSTVRYVRESLAVYRAQSDPRYLGYAGAALGAQGEYLQSSSELLLLRGTLKQSLHDFRGAELDLESALKLDPSNGDAWLTRSIVMQVQGRYDEARRIQWQVIRSCPGLLSATSAAQLASLSGQATRGLQLLEPWLREAPGVDKTQLLWALTVAGEIAGRQGEPDLADGFFRRALALDPDEPYLLGAFADHLTDTNRPAEALSILERGNRSDAMLLRRLMAWVDLKVSQEPAWVVAARKELSTRMTSAAMRGDETHLRERGLFELNILGNAKAALVCAKRNWLVQKEPADLKLLMNAAMAAGDVTAAREAVEWMSLQKQDYPAWNPLVSKARELGSQASTKD